MNIRNTLLLTACITTSVAIHANTTTSAIIPFKTLVDEMCATIPENATRKGSAAQEDIATLLNNTLIDETYTFLNAAYQADALRPLIEKVHDDMQKKIEESAGSIAQEYTTYLFDALIGQTVGYLALQQELATHENVILHFTAPWCPPCQFFAPALERCAQKYAPDVRIISVDITQHKILGVSIESIPVFVFFKKGTVIHRKIGLNFEAVTKKYMDPNSAECKAATLNFLEEDLCLSIEQYLLS